MQELRNFLTRQRLSQHELAEGIGVSDQFVSLILSGVSTPSLETARKIIAFCRTREPGITFEMLFGMVA